MRGRPRASRSSDAASAARRRLAALAAQFEEASPRDESFEQQPSPLRGDGPPGRHAARDAEDGSAPRQRSDDGPWRTGHPELGRWALSHQHLTLILLAVVAVVAVAGWWVLRSVPSSEPVQIASQRTLPSTGGPAIDATGEDPSTAGQTTAAASTLTSVTAPAGADASGTLVVDVAGKVRRPGIVELPSGSRVVDALQRAGGVRPRVDTTGLNLARLLVDGEQIVV
ncbi:MAG: SLBB domain-containing protein, partial [Nocardioidaceae bacterium]